jgi:hypothetical protein
VTPPAPHRTAQQAWSDAVPSSTPLPPPCALLALWATGELAARGLADLGLRASSGLGLGSVFVVAASAGIYGGKPVEDARRQPPAVSASPRLQFGS